MPTKFLNISTDNTLGGISPSDETVVSEKAIKNYVDGAIPTVNDATITITQGGVTKGSFTLNQASGDTIALDAGGGGSVAIDNTTITENASQEIQAVATVNANTAAGATNPVYDWVGTLAEYTAQAVATNHPDWICYITDDEEADAYEAYTKTQSNNLFVAKAHEVIEFQAPTAGNNYTWYRKYADGWVEQGGYVYGSAISGFYTFTLPIAMANTNYSVMYQSLHSGTGQGYQPCDNYTARTTTSIQCYQTAGFYGIGWQVSGMAA